MFAPTFWVDIGARGRASTSPILVGYPRVCASEEAVSEALAEVSIIRGSGESGEETCQSTRGAGQSQREDSPGPTRDAAARAALCGKERARE